MQTKVEKIIPSQSDPTKAAGVIVNGTTLEADVVIMGVGVAPATEYLKSSPGFDLDRTGAVTVDEFLRVKGLDNVYAIGTLICFSHGASKH